MARSRWILFCEWAAGRFLLASARARLRRGTPEDAHELRHITAAVIAGNSDDCHGIGCALANTNTSTAYTSYPYA